MDANDLHKAVAAIAPIIGVAVGDATDKSTWRIDFDKSATPPQQADALKLIDTLDANAVVSAPSIADRLSTVEAALKVANIML